MNADSNETEPDRRAIAISVWENEGGARAPDAPDGQFGRGVEMDRSWTIYPRCSCAEDTRMVTTWADRNTRVGSGKTRI